MGEKFNVRFKSGELASYGPLKFTDDGLIDCNGVEVVHLLVRMFKGDVAVEKLPWKPSNGEKYWYVANYETVTWKYGRESAFYLSCYKLGNCFKTKEDAEQNKDRIMNMLKE